MFKIVAWVAGKFSLPCGFHLLSWLVTTICQPCKHQHILFPVLWTAYKIQERTYTCDVGHITYVKNTIFFQYKCDSSGKPVYDEGGTCGKGYHSNFLQPGGVVGNDRESRQGVTHVTIQDHLHGKHWEYSLYSEIYPN